MYTLYCLDVTLRTEQYGGIYKLLKKLRISSVISKQRGEDNVPIFGVPSNYPLPRSAAEVLSAAYLTSAFTDFCNLSQPIREIAQLNDLINRVGLPRINFMHNSLGGSLTWHTVPYLMLSSRGFSPMQLAHNFT